MANDIPFDIRPEPARSIDIFPANQGVPSQTDASVRAIKYHYTLGGDSPGVDSLYNSIISGQEDLVRNKQAMDQSLKDKQYQLEHLQNYLKDHQGPITQQALENFQSLTAPRQPNPKMDMEKVFSSKLLDELYFGSEDSVVKQAALEHPQETSQFYAVARENIAKQEYVRKRMEDTQKDYEKPKTGPYVDYKPGWWNDFLETMLPVKSWADIAMNSDSGKFFLGSNLADVARKGSMMTADEFQPWFDAQYDAIYAHNPLDAQHFAEAMLSYSSSSEAFDTLGNIADIAGVAPTSLALRGAKGAIKATTSVLGRLKSFDIPEILSSAGKTEEATKSIVLRDIKANLDRYGRAVDEITSLDHQGDVRRLIETAPNLYNPLAFIKGGSLRDGIGGVAETLPDVKSLDTLSITYEKGPQGILHGSIGDGRYEIPKNLDAGVAKPAVASAKKPSEFQLIHDKNTSPGIRGQQYYWIFKGDKKVGDLEYTINGDTIYIGTIDVVGPKPGKTEVRNFLDQLAAKHPEAKFIEGLRVSGARSGRAAKKDQYDNFETDLNVKVPIKLSKGKEVKPEVPITRTDGAAKGRFQGNFQESYTNRNVRVTGDPIELPSAPPPNLTGAFALRVGNKLLEQGIPALNGLADRNAVERLSEQATRAAIDHATDLVKNGEFAHLHDGVIDFGHFIPPEKNLANIGEAVFYMRRPDALPFKTEAEARMFADNEYKLLPGAYDIKAEGSGFHLEIIRPIDETAPRVRDTLIPTGNETKRNFFNSFWGNMRSSDDVNPLDIRTGKKTAVHSIQDQYKAIEQITAPVRALKGNSKRDFIRFTEAMRDFENSGVRGRFFNTLRDFETEWQSMFNRLPNEKEALAYGAYLRAYEWDDIWRNIGIYRSLTRQGIRDFKITKPDGTSTAAFKGRQVKSINWSNNDGILVYDQNQPLLFGRAGDATQFPAEIRSLVDVSLSSGEYKVIQLAQPQMLPLKAELGINDLIEYAIVKDFQSERIAMRQIPFKPGGHVLYNYDFFVKQPRAMWAGSRRLYTHDTTVRPFSLRADAERMVPLYNEAQRLFVLRDPGFDAFVNTHIPEGAARLRSAFEAGDLSTSEPFVLIKRGQSAWGLGEVKAHYGREGGVENYQSSGNNLYQTVNHEYAGDRNYDVATGNGRGSEENPLFRLDTPKYIDPLTTLNRAMATLARNQSLEDFRFLAAEHFVQEFQHALSIDPVQLRSNPIAALFQPKWNESAPRDLQRAAAHFQRSFVDFMHVQTDWGKNVGWLKEKLYEGTVHRIGEARADAIANNKLLKAIQDPIHTVKSLAFVEHLGLFNPMQYFKQYQTMTQITGIAGPLIAAKAAPAGFLSRALMMTAESPAHLSHFGSMASKFGWKSEHFVEMYQAMRRTGLDIVEGEHAWKDDLADPQLFTGKFGKYLNKTTFFFKEGERQTRFSAFAAAYLEWRGANPVGQLDRRALQGILNRQDLMNGNMTRASNAAWQSMGRGVLSVPLQFATYPIRIMEQFVSNRLTAAERMRLVATYSLMYGIPVGVGITPLGVYPFYQDLTQHLLENGVVDDPNPVVEVLHKGLIETITHMISGKPNSAGESLGVGGLQITKDMLTDGKFLEILLGASGSTVGGILESSWPIFKDIAGIFHDGVDGKAPLIAADFGDAMRNVSSVNSAYKLYYALAYGKYVSRNETNVDQMTPFDAVLSSVFGINPQSMDNLSRELDSNKEMKAAQAYAEKQAIKYIRRGLQTDPTDQATRDAYFNQAKVWIRSGDFQLDEMPRILQRAQQGLEPLTGAINMDFFFKNAPASQMKQRQEGLIKLQQSQKKAPVEQAPLQTGWPAIMGVRG